MRTIILLPEEYKNHKAKLIEILQMWEETFQKYKIEYNKKNDTLIYAWSETFKTIMDHLKSDRNLSDCFLILDHERQLQGLAFGARLARGNFSDSLEGKKINSYHIFDMLIAPWNILGRGFSSKSEEISDQLQDKYEKIGTSLVKLIATHADSLDVSQIVAELTPSFDVGGFFRKTLFTQAYVKVGLAYKLDKSMFKNLSILAVFNDNHATFFAAAGKTKIIDNYLGDSSNKDDEYQPELLFPMVL